MHHMTRLMAHAALASFLNLANPSLALDRPPGGLHLAHCTLGGETIDQPKDSPLNFCCYDDGCWQCDTNWQNCTWEPAMHQKPAGTSDWRSIPGTAIDPGRTRRIER